MAAALSARDITCGVHGQGDEAVKLIATGLSIELAAGEIVDLIGPSGSGKSTLLTTLAMLNPFGSASMVLSGMRDSQFTPEQWRRQVVYLPQRPTLIGDTVYDAVLLPFGFNVFRQCVRKTGSGLKWPTFVDRLRDAVARASAGSTENGTGPVDDGRLQNTLSDGGAPDVGVPGKDAVRRRLDALGLRDVELDRSPQDLSVGQQARVCLLRSLLLRPSVLLCDEVDAGLDDASARLVGEELQRACAAGTAILRVRHRSFDGLAHRVLSFANGGLTHVEMPEASAKGAIPTGGSSIRKEGRA